MPWYDENGAHLYYEESGIGEPILLLPGWGGNIGEFAALRERLANDHRVIAVDLPGSGKSGPQPRTYMPNYYRDDVSLLLALGKSLDALPAHLVGFSDGGEYELLIAAQEPRLARSLVTWGAVGTVGTNPEIAHLLAGLIDDPIPPMRDFAAYMKAAYGEANARIMTKSAGNAILKMIENGGDISRSVAHDIRCPVLLITGQHDFLATPDLVSELAKVIPNAKFVEATGASHPVHQEQPEWLVETVAAWISRQ